MGMKDADLALSLFLPQVAAPCVPPSSHELVVSDTWLPALQPRLPSLLSPRRLASLLVAPKVLGPEVSRRRGCVPRLTLAWEEVSHEVPSEDMQGLLFQSRDFRPWKNP